VGVHVKNCGYIAFDLASSETHLDKNLRKPKLSERLPLLAAAALIFGAFLTPMVARAEGTLTQASAQNEVISVLSSFAQEIKKPAAPSDDQALVALQEFAQRLGATEPASIKALPKVAAATKAQTDVVANIVGDKVCLGCHASQTAEFKNTLMGRIGITKPGKFTCESCHGPGSAHAHAGGGRGVGGIISFRPNDTSRTAEENNAICLACHLRGARTLWPGSVHEQRSLMCTNCHTIMKNVSPKNQLRTVEQPDTCYPCHQNIRAKFARYEHMPLPESKMVCSDCHSPHGSYAEKLLKKATVNQVCWQCHAEKRGPFLWEHPPVVENCLNCHEPHGSINENLLKVARGRLCERCHNAATRHPANPRNPVSIFAINGGCTNCHTQIHGSNSPGGIRFLR